MVKWAKICKQVFWGDWNKAVLLLLKKYYYFIIIIIIIIIIRSVKMLNSSTHEVYSKSKTKQHEGSETTTPCGKTPLGNGVYFSWHLRSENFSDDWNE